MMNVLTAVRPTAAFDLDFPLHVETDSESDVARLVGILLNDIARFDDSASHADVLQALAITTAVRMAMADAAQASGSRLAMHLLGLSVESADERAATA